MAQTRFARRPIKIYCALVIAMFAGEAYAQSAADSNSTGSSSQTDNPGAISTDDVRTLIQTVSALQSQLTVVNSQLSQLQADQRRSQQEVQALEDQLAHAGMKPVRLELPPARPRATPQGYGQTPPATEENFTATPINAGSGSSPQNQTLDERVTAAEENEELLNSKVVEQSQTKIESGSKYRVRLSGLVLFNLYDNHGYVDNQDFPEIAVQNVQPTNSTAFGGSLRQSQLGLEVFGPQLAGARTSANISFDFAGGFPDEPNGSVMGLVRLRTATVRFDWQNTSIVAGQDHLFFVPLAPTSFATVAIPALSYAGNLWAWTPQVRVEHRVHFSETSFLSIQGGIMDSLSGDGIFEDENAKYPQWGEQSGLPAFAARVAMTHPFLGQEMTFGAGGYYGRQYWGFGRDVDGWAGTLDATVPLGKMLSLTGAFYRGRALGGLGGGIGQDVLMTGSLGSPNTVVEGLDSMGGWMQLKLKPWQKFEINGAYGEDNPFASELDRFPAGQSYYGASLTRNQSPMVNVIYTPRSDMELSFEYRRLRTMVLDQTTTTADHFDASVGYKF